MKTVTVKTVGGLEGSKKYAAAVECFWEKVIGYMWLRLTSKGKDSMRLKTDPLEAGLFLISRTLTALALLYGLGSIVAPTPNPYGLVGFGLALFLYMATTCDDGPYIGY